MPEGIIEPMQFSLITDPIEWDELGGEWQALAENTHTPVPFLEFWYLKTWWQSLGGGEWQRETSRLQIITARQDGVLIGAAPLFFTQKEDAPPALRFIGQVEVSDYLDFLCPQDHLQPFLAGLFDFIQNEPRVLTPALDLANFMDNSPSLPILRALCEQRGITCSSEILQPSPYIPLKTSWEDYLASISKKQRHEIRRKIRNAETRHETNWYILGNGQNSPKELQAFIDMMRNDPDKVSFLTPKMAVYMEQMAASALEQNRLHLSFLTLDGQKSAAFLSFLGGNKLWVYNSAMEPAFTANSPGWVLLAKEINWAIEQGMTEVDMMRGDEAYKYRFGGIDRHVISFKARLA